MALFKWLFGRTAAPTTRTSLSSSDFRVPEGEFRFIALDVETANRWQGSICQIGLACVRPDNSVETIGTHINPNCDFDDINIQIHGIRPQHVARAPTFRTILDRIVPLLRRQPVVQHSTFDETAIRLACEDEYLVMPQFHWIDSVRIAQRAWPELRGNGGHGLAHLKQALSLDFRHHDATEDARAAAHVVLRAESKTGMNFLDLSTAPPRARTARKAEPRVTVQGKGDGPLAGQVAVFTGSLSMSREKAAQLAAAAGITVAATVTLKTTLVIVGDQDLSNLAGHTKSGKHRKAEEYIARGNAIRIVGEAEFLKIVAEPDPSDLPPPTAAAAPVTPRRKMPEPALSPDEADEIVVFTTADIIPDDAALLRAAQLGIAVMKNVTNRTTIVVVPTQHLTNAEQVASTRHRAAIERIAGGQDIRIIGDEEFRDMIDRG